MKMKTSYWEEDIEILVSRKELFQPFAGKNILITGTAGLIGKMLVSILCAYENENKTGLKVFAQVRDLNKAKSEFGEPTACLKYVVGNVNEPLTIGAHIHYIVHTASITSSRMFVEKPVETITTLIDGTKNVLELAKGNHGARVGYLSSLEVYGVPDMVGKVAEDYAGYIDFTAIRSSYSEGKRMAECLCNSYASEYDVPVVTTRLTQTFGPGVKYNDGRVFAQFARSVIEETNIVLNTAGRTLRNYCYIRDAVAGILTVLGKGILGEAYNIANKNTGITIADMAKMVCDDPRLGNGKIELVFNHPEAISQFGYNPEMQIELDTSKIESLGWHSEVDLPEMFERLIHDMRLENETSICHHTGL